MTRTRRDFLRRTSAAFGALAGASLLPQGVSALVPDIPAKPVADRLLFVFTATGGASIVDSFLSVAQSECSSQSVADELIVYPDAFVKTFAGTGIRALDLPPEYRTYLGGLTGNGYQMSSFVQKHLQDMAVMTVENTSVNHLVAQERAMTGQGVNRGRTIGEHIADIWGQNLVLPHVNMAQGGYLERGSDPTLSDRARAETVASPLLFPLSTDGMRGMIGAPGAAPGQAPTLGLQLDRGRALLARARGVRNELDATSVFGKTFSCSQLRQRFADRRATDALGIEDADLISRLMMLSQSQVNLSGFGLEENAAAMAARKVIVKHPSLPGDMDFLTDPLLAQTLLAYLLTSQGFSSAVTIGPSLSPNPSALGVEPPLAFDYSHNNHVAGQAAMWARTLDQIDKLITLLKKTPAGEGTMWDRSTIYIATDFGRDKRRNIPGQPLQTDEGDVVNTSHHLNNGSVIISPRLKGGRVYGGVNPDSLLTYGFDRESGEDAPGTVMRIGDVYSAVAQTLDAPFPGQIPIPAMVKS